MIILESITHKNNINVVGEKYRGDGYRRSNDGFHTVGYYLKDFIGTVKIQATLATEPSDNDWFDVNNTSIGDGVSSISENLFRNFTGNFVWIRVVVENFTAGSITKIAYNK